MDEIISQIEGEDASQEVDAEYKIYDKNTKLLLGSENIDSYLNIYDEICKDNIAILECFDFDNAQDLQNYISEQEISFDSLKIETANASREALKFLIYEAEDEEY